MFYTMAKVDCSSASDSTPICDVRDSYRLVYFLLVGEPIVDIKSPTTLPVGMTALVALCTILFFLVFLAVVFVAMLVSSKSDSETVALNNYWEPKLSLVVSSKSARAAAARYKKGMWIPQPSWIDRFENHLEHLWGISMCLAFGIRRNQYWYAAALAPGKKLLLSVALIFVIPMWLLMGLLTVGLLWPPQVRLFLFQPRMCLPSARLRQGKEFLTSQVAGIKDEIVQFKSMSYEQFHDVQQDIRHLKAMLAASLSD